MHKTNYNNITIYLITYFDICEASLQKGPDVTIYQSRETMSQSTCIIYQFLVALGKIISWQFMLVNIVLHHSIFFFFSKI